MFRYKLRTLLIVLALGPPLLAVGWSKYLAWRVEQARRQTYEQRLQQLTGRSDSTQSRLFVEIGEPIEPQPPTAPTKAGE